MKVLGTSVPIITGDIDGALERFRAITGEAVRQQFEIAERGIRIASLGSVTIIAGPDAEIGALRHVRVTFIVDSIADYKAHLQSTGATILEGPSHSPAGTTMIVRDLDGVVLEFVEPFRHESSQVDRPDR